jgi:hypothetical protein
MSQSTQFLILDTYVELFIDEKQFTKRMKKVEGEAFDFIIKGADATTHFLINKDHKTAIVCIRKRSKCSKLQNYVLLVHEAVHIWQDAKERMRETEAGREIEAYVIQSLSHFLMQAYDKEIKKG